MIVVRKVCINYPDKQKTHDIDDVEILLVGPLSHEQLLGYVISLIGRPAFALPRIPIIKNVTVSQRLRGAEFTRRETTVRQRLFRGFMRVHRIVILNLWRLCGFCKSCNVIKSSGNELYWKTTGNMGESMRLEVSSFSLHISYS